MDGNRFTSATVRTLSDRASTTCSNPSCRAITHGPSSDELDSINVGQAAHIRGANRGSARYDELMSEEERRSIVNGIWLCSKCSKMIDDDPKNFTVELLYIWKDEHESEIREKMGYGAGEREARLRIRHHYREESPAALQIALDKPEHWEWLLFIQLWRDKTQKVSAVFSN